MENEIVFVSKEKANVEKVKERNEEIQALFSALIEERKKLNVKTFDEFGNLDENIKKLLQAEMEKCVAIYCAEYGFETPNNKFTVEVDNSKLPMPNAKGSENGITVFSQTQDSFKGLEALKLEGDGLYATSVNGTEITSTGILNVNDNSNVSSTRDSFDQFYELIKNEKCDLEFILDVVAHETMHIFVPGDTALVEGTTEQLTRQAADKYGLRLSPTSHSKETRMVALLEEIVGVDAVKSIALTNDQKNRRTNEKSLVDNERYETLRKTFDEKVGQGKFDELKEQSDIDYQTFQKMRKEATPSNPRFLDLIADGITKYRVELFNDIIGRLENWKTKYPNELVEKSNHDITDEQLRQIFEIQNKQCEVFMKLLGKEKVNLISPESKGKNALEDCMEDYRLRISTEQIATRIVKNAVKGRDENSREENNIGE